MYQGLRKNIMGLKFMHWINNKHCSNIVEALNRES